MRGLAPGLAAAICAVLAFLMLGPSLSSLPSGQDKPLLRPLPKGPLRLTVFGTSLSAPPQIWPDRLGQALATCRGAPVLVARVVGPGRGSAWALEQLDRVAATAPDLVLIEFAINDADLRDGVSLATARRQHLQLLAQLHGLLPRAELVLMTMNPARGPRGWLRPRLAAHYAQYSALATEADAALIDLYPRWRATPKSAQGLAQDGLHPDPAQAARIIVPAALSVLHQGADCPG